MWGFVSAVLIVLGSVQVAVADGIVGRATVIDGDTIEIHGERIRLFGIDAPESGQFCADNSGRKYRCGQRAALALDALVSGRSVSCDDRGRDRYGRLISVCRTQDRDLGAAMVRSGMAVAYRRYSMDYVSAEGAAQREGVGMWQGDFDTPSDWRAKGRY